MTLLSSSFNYGIYNIAQVAIKHIPLANQICQNPPHLTTHNGKHLSVSISRFIGVLIKHDWRRKVVKPGEANRQTRKYFYGKK